MRNKPTVIEIIAICTAALIVIVFIVALAKGGAPKDYKYDILTDTTTWTDTDGRKMIKSPDGSVRELSND